MWDHTGKSRPDFANEPGPGQESVWDYPRPPVAKRCNRLVEVRDGDVEIARTKRSCRLLETASPPTFYLPPDDVDVTLLRPGHGASFCEWKGQADYWDLVSGADRARAVAWSYPRINDAFEAIEGWYAFYPGRVDGCFVDGERVTPQPGAFYGGWITREIRGPVKGAAGTEWW